MRSDPRRGRRLLSLLPLTALLCGSSACTPGIAISRAALPCSDLVQGPLAADVAPADLPPDPATVADWQVFGDAQTGRLETSNLYRRAALDVIRRCEARDRAVDQQLKAR